MKQAQESAPPIVAEGALLATSTTTATLTSS